MHVGCWDCSKKIEGKNFERPKGKNPKNTVVVCEKCKIIWLLKEANKANKNLRQTEGNYWSYYITPALDAALKYLAELA